MKVGEEVQFIHKKRTVKGVVHEVLKKRVNIQLTKDYRGKNEYWSVGEVKDFSIKNISEVKVLRHIIGFKTGREAGHNG